MKTFIFLYIISMILFVGTFARSTTLEEVIQLSTKAKEAKKNKKEDQLDLNAIYEEGRKIDKEHKDLSDLYHQMDNTGYKGDIGVDNPIIIRVTFEKLEEAIKAEDELNKSLKLSHDFHNTGYRGEAIDKLARGEINTDEARDIFQHWLDTDYKKKSQLERISYNSDYLLRLASRETVFNKTLLSSALASIEIINVFVDSDNLNRLKKNIVFAMEQYNINSYYAVYMIVAVILLVIFVYFIARLIIKATTMIIKKFKRLNTVDMEINISFKDKKRT